MVQMTKTMAAVPVGRMAPQEAGHGKPSHYRTSGCRHVACVYAWKLHKAGLLDYKGSLGGHAHNPVRARPSDTWPGRAG